MKPDGKGAAATPVVDPTRDLAKQIFDRIRAHDAAEASAKALPARKVGVEGVTKVKARRR